ncbi:metallophosphoesterase [Empedobacter stercoris]|uniref:metallophosphoesterase n=1 Tax=Empedobacter stercoris TaxID=1628248 RepID=UPI0021AE7E2B|nr:metallophosphoesterase [Empedobacter stercoris]UWX67633.1 metallophosphoesterase [Empedobacter stercoris]
MKLLPTLNNKKLNYPFLALVGSCLYMTSCATQHPQYGKNIKTEKTQKVEGNKIQSIYLIGDAGDLDQPINKQNLKTLKNELAKADSTSYLFFLGDNIYENGIVVDSTKKNYTTSRDKLQLQIDLAKEFKGKTLFIPGNHDWKNGVKGLKEQEKIVKKQLGNKKAFLPKDACPIDKINVNDSIGIIALDSEWYLQDWDNHPGLNEKCDIKSREAFFEELESQLNKYQNRTTIITMHHPLFSNGTHGGQFDFKKQFYPFGDDFKVPLPIIGSFINLLRSTTGLSPQDVNNFKYREMASRIATIIENRNNVIVVSGHDHNLQYIQQNNVKQIISGSGSKKESAKAVGKNDFSYGDNGFVVLDLYDNGASLANFYGFKNDEIELLLSKQVTEKKKQYLAQVYDDKKMPKTKETSVYELDVTKKSDPYKFFFGRHYRKTFGQTITANTVNLNQLYGGLTPIRMGGGHQTKSLRLVNNKGEEYNMRSVKKSATQFIQQVAFKNKYVADEFEDSFTEKFLMDFYTTNHPYYPLAVANLMKPIHIMHATPKLFYVPKQETLKEYNENFGDELYMIEERPMAGYQDGVFGKPTDIVSTDDMLFAIQKNKDVIVDKQAYIRARLFDMLVGDWDRHSDQWRWGAYEENGKTIYRAIPRDRDQAFPRYDGLFFNLIMRIPPLRHMQDYKDDIKNVKWFNREPYPLDLAILESSDLNLWKQEARYIQENLSDEYIKQSFELIPTETKQEYDQDVINHIISRKSKLEKFAEEYNKILRKLIILKGTDEDDEFIITRLAKGKTAIKIYSGKEKTLIFDEEFDKKETKEIRLYGLNGKDKFRVEGKPSNAILTRIIGGIDDDDYEVKRAAKIKVYDYANGSNASESTFLTSKNFVNDYEVNTYDYKQPMYNFFTMLPNIGYNPDDGLKIGLSPTYTINGFDRKPYSQRHNLQVSYYFATGGWDAKYKGTFTKALGKWNLDLNAAYTSPTYSTNFFGFGNETVNNQEEIGIDYNRVRLESYSIGPSIFKIMNNNGRLDFSTIYSYKKIEENLDRIVGDLPDINRDVFKGQHFGEIGAKYLFKNYDNESLPKLGMTFLAHAKWISNLTDFERNHFYTELNLGFTHKISANGRLTVASMLKGKAIWGDFMEFYQMANLGGDQDLRGYRLGRFAGDKVFLQTSDLRFDALRFKAIVPLRLGVFVGADYGRVWLNGEDSDKWHSSMGGGLWINGAQSITATISYFKGEDPGRVVFGLNFGF